MKTLILKKSTSGQFIYSITDGSRTIVPDQYGTYDRESTIVQARGRFSFDTVEPEPCPLAGFEPYPEGRIVCRNTAPAVNDSAFVDCCRKARGAGYRGLQLVAAVRLSFPGVTSGDISKALR